LKVIICGDRHWNNYDSILDVVKRLKAKYDEVTVIQGECEGADLLAKKAAIACGIPVKGYPAEWKKYGKAAGPLRNQQMIDSEKPDMIIAFHSDIEHSKGTKDMVYRAKSHGIKCFIITK
jgi:hypothetical protein